MPEKYHMNLPEREIHEEKDLQAILKEGKYAMVAMCRNNEPYVVTLSYGYDAESDVLYLHSPISGLKLDILKDNPKVCATVIQDKGYQAGKCTHSYRSVVLFGTMAVIADPAEKVEGMKVLLKQLEEKPQEMEEKLLRTTKFLEDAVVIKCNVTAKTGKELLFK